MSSGEMTSVPLPFGMAAPGSLSLKSGSGSRNLCLALCKTQGYSVAMNTSTLTIRLPVEQREALKRSAKALKKTESEYIRDLLQRDLDARPLSERVGHLIGCLDSSELEPSDDDRLRETIRSNNWRPV